MPYKDKKKQAEHQRLRVTKRREDYFKYKVCEKCGSTKNLELHHKDPEEKESHRIWSWSDKRREAELKKCVVWCKKCHRSYHSNLLKRSVPHGTHSGYSYHGCRCDLCKKSHNEYQKEWIKRSSSIGRACASYA